MKCQTSSAQVGERLGLVPPLLDVVLAEVALAGCVGLADRVGGLGLGHRDERHARRDARRAPGRGAPRRSRRLPGEWQAEPGRAAPASPRAAARPRWRRCPRRRGRRRRPGPGRRRRRPCRAARRWRRTRRSGRRRAARSGPRSRPTTAVSAGPGAPRRPHTPGEHRVVGAGERAEHAPRVAVVARLAQDLARQDHRGVGREHELPRRRLDRARLLPRHPAHVGLGRLAGRTDSSVVDGPHLDREAEGLRGAPGDEGSGRRGRGALTDRRRIATTIAATWSPATCCASCERTVDELQAFNDIGRSLTSTLDIREVLALIMQKVSEVLRPGHWSLLLARRADAGAALRDRGGRGMPSG